VAAIEDALIDALLSPPQPASAPVAPQSITSSTVAKPIRRPRITRSFGCQRLDRRGVDPVPDQPAASPYDRWPTRLPKLDFADGRDSDGAVAAQVSAAPRRAAVDQARVRLDRLELYSRPVRLSGVRLLVTPWLFRLPWFRRFGGYAAHRAVFLRGPAGSPGYDDLICHELCHVWQMQHRPLRMPLSYLMTWYEANPYEAEARAAVEQTRAPG